jgi:hypothetical protein
MVAFAKDPIDDWEQVYHPPPHDTCRWVKFDAHIRNNATGEVRVYHTDGIWAEEEECAATFIWRDGNFGCDCNRALFYGYAIGKKYDDIDHPCGHEGYAVTLVNPMTRKVFYEEFKITE